jgi:hypothetical protein
MKRLMIHCVASSLLLPSFACELQILYKVQLVLAKLAGLSVFLLPICSLPKRQKNCLLLPDRQGNKTN